MYNYPRSTLERTFVCYGYRQAQTEEESLNSKCRCLDVFNATDNACRSLCYIHIQQYNKEGENKVFTYTIILLGIDILTFILTTILSIHKQNNGSIREIEFY